MQGRRLLVWVGGRGVHSFAARLRHATCQVVKLDRGFDGLRQTWRTWHNRLVRGMMYLGFEKSLADACIMRLVDKGTVTVMAFVHVDDALVVGSKSRCEQLART